jgi:predicted N-formylglutamate amidohydrolase
MRFSYSNDSNVINEYGSSSIILVCEHASNHIPLEMGNLGLSVADRNRHIAVDIGVAELSQIVSQAINAPLIFQNYSRLIIDCNRPLNSADLIPVNSDHVIIPGNIDLSQQDRDVRINQIFHPFHRKINQVIKNNELNKTNSILVPIHSFTPVMNGASRPWEFGILFGDDKELAFKLKELIKAENSKFSIGLNKPYRVTKETMYTIPVHGDNNKIHSSMIEVRQDLLSSQAKILKIAALVIKILKQLEHLVENQMLKGVLS